ncbi:MAG: sugar kinase [Paracoccaceae bacterium]
MRVLSLGEMMVELSGAGPGLWRQGFAGDTFNTAWYMAALRPGWRVSYGTRLGLDAMSDAALAEAEKAGLMTGWITRDPQRSIGLYMISLQEGERSFSYWRDHSAARRLADDPAWLRDACDAADVIYLSGITLAILDPAGRDRLLATLAGRRVAFDPNLRRRLWESDAIMCQTVTAAAAISEICLPSFDDEAGAFGDAGPDATAARYARAGSAEVVVKNGTAPMVVGRAGQLHRFEPHIAVTPVDTTGAGDSFNAGYLCARLAGADLATSVTAGQALAARVVQHPGALLPRDALQSHILEIMP